MTDERARGWKEAFEFILTDACIDRDGTVTLDRDHVFYTERLRQVEVEAGAAPAQGSAEPPRPIARHATETCLDFAGEIEFMENFDKLREQLPSAPPEGEGEKP